MIAELLGRPRLLLSLCALFWAGNFVLGRAMHADIPPIGLSFWRWATASAIVLPFVWGPIRRQWPLLRSHLWRMSALALIGVSGFHTFAYLGLQTTTATNSVLIQSTLPVQVLVLNRLLFRTPVRAVELASILLSMAGVVVIITRGAPSQLLSGDWVVGDAWILGAAFAWSLYSVLLRWRPDGLEPAAFLGFTLLVGTAALFPLYLSEHAGGRTMDVTLPTLATVAYVAVFPSVLAYVFWNRGVAMLGANAAGHFIHLMPVFGSVMAAVFLGEVFGGYHAAGAALVAAGIGMVWLRRSVRGVER